MAKLQRVSIPIAFITNSTIFISWELPALATVSRRPATVDEVIIKYKPTTEPSYKTVLVKNGELNVTLTGLKEMTQYNILLEVIYSDPSGFSGEIVERTITTRNRSKI